MMQMSMDEKPTGQQDQLEGQDRFGPMSVSGQSDRGTNRRQCVRGDDRNGGELKHLLVPLRLAADELLERFAVFIPTGRHRGCG